MDVWADSGVSFDFMAATRPDFAHAGGPVPRRLRPASRLVPKFAADVRGACTSARRIAACSPTASPWMRRAARCPSPLGNVIAPQKVVGSLGADVLRLWVAATDYANEMSVSDALLNRTADAYRRMRNTVRFLLGNLHGFDPHQDLVHPAADGGAGSLGRDAHRAAAGGDRRGLPRVRLPSGLSQGPQLLHRGLERDLSGHRSRPALHHAGRQSRAPLGAKRAVPHRPRHGALAGADAVLHGRGDLAAPARGAGRVGVPGAVARAAGRGRPRYRLAGASCS